MTKSHIAIITVLFLAMTLTVLFMAATHVDAATPQYLVVESPGRDAPIVVYQKLLNDKAAQGWEFDNWLYRGSMQTPDLIFKRK